MNICFVTAPGQNAFFDELVDALRAELTDLGVSSQTAVGGFPEVDAQTVYALVPPHEYFALTPEKVWPTNRHLRRTVFICAEQPNSSFWHENAALIRRHGCPAFDINRVSAELLTMNTGRHVGHFQLGWSRSWAHTDPTAQTAEEWTAARDVEVLHLGTRSPHREAVLAKAAGLLHNRECRLVLGDDAGPLTELNPEWVGEDFKWSLLNRSRLMINVHRGAERYFEWLRVVQAISNGVVVLSESSLDTEPLVPSAHFFESPTADIGLVADTLACDLERLHETACVAYEFLRDELPLSTAVADFGEAADRLLGRRSKSLPATATGSVASTREPSRFDHARRMVAHDEADHLSRIEERVGRYAREQKLQMKELRGEVARLSHLVASGRDLPVVERIYATPAYEAAVPRVSVITPLYNYEDRVQYALASVANSTVDSIEAVVVDDGSTDGSREAAETWLREHPDVPGVLLAHPTNRGLGQARNTAIDAARGEFVFALDADNSVFPTGIAKLVRTLAEHEQAAFAWGYLECHDPQFRPVGILSSYAWDPHRFGNGNYIDAMVLWRRSAFKDWGHYTTDPGLYGWEDYELFARIAQGGGFGVMTPQFVARYRVSELSMISTANMAGTAMLKQLMEMYPDVMGARQSVPATAG